MCGYPGVPTCSYASSAVQRFIVNEPVIIAMAVLIPLLFASECCANMCTEVGSKRRH